MNADVQARVAQVICRACGENPFHAGEGLGNDYKWQDYMHVARAAFDAMQMSKSQAKRIAVQKGEKGNG